MHADCHTDTLESANHQMAVINDVLDFDMLTNRKPVPHTPVDLDNMAAQVVRMLQHGIG